jgi:tetratricopeptide (TPR) repeat protein
VEGSLSNRSRQVVNRYKSISERGNWQVLEEAEDEANKLWVKYGDPLGHTTVFLWLADLYWRSGELGGVLQHCKKALDLAPGVPASVQVFLTKAVAYYMLGLAHQMQGNLVAMLEALQEASSLFESSQNYWQRLGNYSLASIGAEIEKWIKTLIAYANELRQNPSTESETKVIYPLRASTGDKYALAELIPTATVNGYEAEEAQSDFMLQRSQARLSFESIRQIGYQVKPNLRVFDASSAFTAYMLQALNPYARLGSDLILPAGGFYHMLPIDDQLANAKRNIRRGDYLLACDVNPIVPDLWRLVQLKGESVIYGLFERDEAGQIKILPASIRSIGESQTKLDLIGQADFILRPT